MRNNILFLFLTLIIPSILAEDNQLKNSTFNIEDRIISGKPTNIKYYPHHVALLKDNSFYCGGSLIKYNWVLTAAHCTKGSAASRFKIRAGSSYTTKYGVISSVIKVLVNPKFTFSSLSHDISLLKLRNSLKSYTTKYSIKTIAMATTLPNVGSPVRLPGWGAINVAGTKYPQRLQNEYALFIAKSKCQASYQNSLDSAMFCAGKWTGGKGDCYGDSGGGLLYKNTLIGTVSFGIVCAEAKQPTVYANVPLMRKWILNTIKAN